MGPKLGHEAVVTGTVDEDRMSIQSESVAILRTLTARIHSAFSCVLNALHSLRMAGFVQERFFSEYGWSSADQKVARARENSLRTSIAGGKGV